MEYWSCNCCSTGIDIQNSGLEGYISRELYKLYGPGTRPTEKTTKEEVEQLKGLLILLVEKTEIDLINKKFVIYNEKMTGTGFYLSSLKDALEFINYHEGLHLGFMMNIRKFI